MKKTLSKKYSKLSDTQITESEEMGSLHKNEPKRKRNSILRKCKKHTTHPKSGLQIENVIGNATECFSGSEDLQPSGTKYKEYVFVFVFNDEVDKEKNFAGENKHENFSNSDIDGMDIFKLTSAFYDKYQSSGNVKVKNVCFTKSFIKRVATKIVDKMLFTNKTKTDLPDIIKAEYFLVLNPSTPEVVKNKSSIERTVKQGNCVHAPDQIPEQHSMYVDGVQMLPAESSLLAKDSLNKEKLVSKIQESQHEESHEAPQNVFLMVEKNTEQHVQNESNDESQNPLVGKPTGVRSKCKREKIIEESMERKTSCKVPLTCTKCNKMFKNTFTHKRYIEKGPFKCHCGKAYISQFALTNHQCQVHKTKKCKVCGDICNKSSELARHMLTVHGYESKTADKGYRFLQRIVKPKQPCPFCDKTLGSINTLNSHLEAIHKLRTPCTGEVLICGTCEKSYKSLGSYVSHKITLHKEKITESELRSTVEKLASEGTGTINECDRCHKRFDTKAKLQTHVYRTHTSSATSLHCEKCDIQFGTRTEFYAHKYSAQHVPPEKRSCQICHKTFDSLRCLWGHRFVHATKSLCCPECGSKFKRKGDYNKHMRDKHGMSNASASSGGMKVF